MNENISIYEFETSSLVDEYKLAISSNNNNSYKYVLGLSILQISPSYNRITFEQIADKVLNIYIRNILEYNLKEYNASQVPETIKMIKNYFEDRDIKHINIRDRKELIERMINNKKNGFFKYVLACFTGAKKNINGYYEYPSIGENKIFSNDLSKKEIILTDNFLNVINEEYDEIKIITTQAYINYLQKKNSTNIKEVFKSY